MNVSETACWYIAYFVYMYNTTENEVTLPNIHPTREKNYFNFLKILTYLCSLFKA